MLTEAGTTDLMSGYFDSFTEQIFHISAPWWYQMPVRRHCARYVTEKTEWVRWLWPSRCSQIWFLTLSIFVRWWRVRPWRASIRFIIHELTSRVAFDNGHLKKYLKDVRKLIEDLVWIMSDEQFESKHSLLIAFRSIWLRLSHASILSLAFFCCISLMNTEGFFSRY